MASAVLKIKLSQTPDKPTNPNTADTIGGFFIPTLSSTATYLSPPRDTFATMQPIGVHIIKTAYGQWLPGDPRGHWSAAWSPKQGHHNPHQLNPADPVRQQ